jgi:hypothetical protein
MYENIVPVATDEYPSFIFSPKQTLTVTIALKHFLLFPAAKAGYMAWFQEQILIHLSCGGFKYSGGTRFNNLHNKHYAATFTQNTDDETPRKGACRARAGGAGGI